MSRVSLEITGGIARLRLEHPAKMNAFTIPMLRDLESHLIAIEQDPAIRAVILTGEGDRAFCTGADINAWGDLSPAEFARGRAAGAVNVPLERLSAAALQGFDLHAPVYVICKSGMRSLMGVQRLRHEGVATVVNVTGGTDAWMWAGLPVESDHAGSRLG